jgi:hypothetical protein
MTKIGLWLGAAAVAALAYITAVSPALQQGLGASAAAIVRPLVIPLIELINVPAFVYCAALVIFMAGLAACVVYQIAAVRPYLAELRAVRSAVGDLPQPRLNGVVTAEAWAEARQHLGTLLQSCPLRRCLVGLPGRIAARPRGSKSPFFSFVAAEPSDGGPSGSSPPQDGQTWQRCTSVRRADNCLAQPVSPPGKGLGAPQPKRADIPPLGIHLDDAPKALSKHDLIVDGL